MPYSYDNLPDALDLFNEHEARQDRQERKLPMCDCCGERIVKEKFFNVEGTYICPTCIEDYIVNTDEYLEG